MLCHRLSTGVACSNWWALSNYWVYNLAHKLIIEEQRLSLDSLFSSSILFHTRIAPNFLQSTWSIFPQKYVNFKTRLWLQKKQLVLLTQLRPHFDQFLDRHRTHHWRQKIMSLAKGICQMSSLLTLVGDIRLRKSDSIEHIGGSPKEVRCKPKYFSLTFTARTNLAKV